MTEPDGCAVWVAGVVQDTDHDGVLSLALAGGGSLTAALHPALVGPLAPILSGGCLVDVTVALLRVEGVGARDAPVTNPTEVTPAATVPEQKRVGVGLRHGLPGVGATRVRAVVTHVAPAGGHPRGDPDQSGTHQRTRTSTAPTERACEDFEVAPDPDARTPRSRPVPWDALAAFLPLAQQRRAWAEVSPVALRRAQSVVDGQLPFAVAAPPSSGAGPGAGSRFLELGGYPGALPSPTDGWGALAAAVGSLRPFQVRLLDMLPVSVARELSDDSPRLDQRLLSAPAACTTLREVGLLLEQLSTADAAPDAAPGLAPGEDWGVHRWSIGRLCGHLVRHEIELDDLAPWLAVGFADPLVAAAFRDAGLVPDGLTPSQAGYAPVRAGWGFTVHRQLVPSQTYVDHEALPALAAAAAEGQPVVDALLAVRAAWEASR